MPRRNIKDVNIIPPNEDWSWFGSYLGPLATCVCPVSGCCVPLGWRSCQSSPFLMMEMNAAGEGEWPLRLCYRVKRTHTFMFPHTSASTSSSRLYLLTIASVFFSTWVATASNTSSTGMTQKHIVVFQCNINVRVRFLSWLQIKPQV